MELSLRSRLSSPLLGKTHIIHNPQDNSTSHRQLSVAAAGFILNHNALSGLWRCSSHYTCKPELIPSGHCAGRCCWLTDFLEYLPFPSLLNFCTAPYLPRFTLKTSILHDDGKCLHNDTCEIEHGVDNLPSLYHFWYNCIVDDEIVDDPLSSPAACDCLDVGWVITHLDFCELLIRFAIHFQLVGVCKGTHGLYLDDTVHSANVKLFVANQLEHPVLAEQLFTIHTDHTFAGHRPVLKLYSVDTVAQGHVPEGHHVLRHHGTLRTCYCLLGTSEVFDGIGCLKGFAYDIDLIDQPNLHIYPPTRVPYSIRDKVKEELDSMVQNYIIEPITEPTPAVSPMVVVHKNGKVKISIDPSDINKNLKRGGITHYKQ
ncbi:hypothetical protein PR048_018398 [Dryococelus australis]|uniref:Uncharacterized protein n=1 Tax=Dryococelus australis TaxID=614101 RepID=A0ABQ9HC62_9NEOP|nr:hypothetical protein PR048_018398 [Dryococelus australis]